MSVSAAAAWLVRPSPHNILRIDEFRSQHIIAIGWPALGDLTGCSREQIKQLLSQPPYAYSGQQLGSAYATVDLFINQMQVGDLVLTPHNDDIFLGRVESAYSFVPSRAEEGYAHQRKVEWLANCSRSALSKELRSSLKQRSVTALSRHLAEIEALSRGEHYTAPGKETPALSVSYPLRPDFSVTFEIPKDITETEAKRLSTYFSTLYFR